ncbi:hypothetical protein NDU88_008902 [Pleurodeles waltl]|uniref:Uncharacterized protein n=1 Tax=Pleurodeles waltl TaxID=8319 RepID=A0AAV7RZ03_PLEWA|nr:hypothetical protein NDU88_008902 [Pleurodeles waltl]
MMAEQWEETEAIKVILTYTRELKEALHAVWEDVHTQLKETQTRQKTHDDTGSKNWELTIGQKVLLLLATTENKLLARWQGPYTVHEKVTLVTYRIEIPIGSDKSQIYQINLLKMRYEKDDNDLNLYITTSQESEIPVFPTPPESDEEGEPHFASGNPPDKPDENAKARGIETAEKIARTLTNHEEPKWRPPPGLELAGPRTYGKGTESLPRTGGLARAPGPFRRQPCVSAEFGEEARPYGGGRRGTRRRGSPRTGPQTIGGNQIVSGPHQAAC